ncbi:hypothetical protein BGW36DRAFT_370602 [Talaromyces proteolyticus]|uniref:DUF6891 domain-containing protein n=1 Tax=Talaromyces proteolyticus TaxID=1131652 RepID=A0AAD4KZW4_9EURO|nr:uncharacterized protein BGW36DRAFT_370602 [Talaromyces proteolyticus]KAH8704107.1 hypothetical protein BGW36DRAFT_370602 [Talaromyces proteolyticus]
MKPTPSSTPGPSSNSGIILDIPDQGPEDLLEAQNTARVWLQRGYSSLENIIEDLHDYFSLDADNNPNPSIGRFAEYLLHDRLQEQAGWLDDEQADMEKLIEAYKTLEKEGIVARANFTCCGTCGNAEIGGEAENGQVGYCYFHEQDTDRCIEWGGLCLRYGVIGDDYNDKEKRMAMGNRVAKVLEDSGLEVEWDRNPERVIDLPNFKWQVRLYEGARVEDEESGDKDADDIGIPLKVNIREAVN